MSIPLEPGEKITKVLSVNQQPVKVELIRGAKGEYVELKANTGGQ
jgi:hypothetical protein